MAHKSQWGESPYTIHNPNGDIAQIKVSGRDRWALECLILAAGKGCTPIDTPGPRWSGYVFNLRGLGVDIGTIHEKHEGPFQGTHARYVLISRVTRGWTEAAQ